MRITLDSTYGSVSGSKDTLSVAKVNRDKLFDASNSVTVLKNAIRKSCQEKSINPQLYDQASRVNQAKNQLKEVDRALRHETSSRSRLAGLVDPAISKKTSSHENRLYQALALESARSNQEARAKVDLQTEIFTLPSIIEQAEKTHEIASSLFFPMTIGERHLL
ncbi:hypothetical protein COB11_00055 [Candidatus Aerophobetes bacterium]|uniref:Uncharacterized protein n=1 Tax=Aerophobetes bacterium TaxID=2030807 RepID=A0A2A4YN06_UNCAE|nr:MAG: hypothetical protein COB11_00055 [Candidatus Aerophobetes bacterium]